MSWSTESGRVRRPAPTEWWGKHSAAETWRAATEGRPYGVSGKSQQNQTTGGASPAPTESWGKHSAAETWRAATEGRPYGVSGKSQQNQTTGGACPAPTESWGKHSVAENRRAAVRRSRPTYSLIGPQLKNRLEQPYNCSRRFSLFSNDDQYASFSSSQLFSSLMGTRTCSMVSRSRIVTALSAGVLSSPTVWKSTVMQ